MVKEKYIKNFGKQSKRKEDDLPQDFFDANV